jgi:hypothetical protein
LPSSERNVHDEVDQLVRAIAARNPTLLFTTSAIAKELDFPEDQVREALFIQCTRGLLEASTRWRCIECDSPALGTVYERDAVTKCHDCGEDREFVSILYFHPTEYLKSRLTEASDSPKKDAAAQDAAVDRIASATSEPPHHIDKVGPAKLDEMIAAVKDVSFLVMEVRDETARGTKAAERGAVASEAGARAGTATAENTTVIRNDPSTKEGASWTKATFWATVVGVIVTAAVALFVWWAADTHLLQRLLPEPRPSPTAHPTPKVAATPAASAKPRKAPKHHATNLRSGVIS